MLVKIYFSVKELFLEVIDNLTNEKRDKDVPLIVSFNPLFNKLGWEVLWEYEYVAGVLTKSKIHWIKLSEKHQSNQ